MTTSIGLGGSAAAPLALRMLHFPVTRIVLALVFFMLPFLLIQAGATHFFEEKLFSRLGQLFGACVGCLSYAFYVITIEKRAVSELALLASGLLFGGMHLVNDNISVLGIANIAVAGVFFASAFLLTELSGPDWLTGGAFGIEGSAVDLVLLAWRRGRIVRPTWTRSRV